MSQQQLVGQIGEWACVSYFVLLHHYHLIHKNYRCRVGEVDCIFSAQQTIIFTEVKTRTSGTYEHATASVDISKRKRILRTAEWFLHQYPFYGNRSIRFDVVVIMLNNLSIHWIPDAFGDDTACHR